MSALARFHVAAQPLVDRDKFEAQGFITARSVLDVGLLESLLADMDEVFVARLRGLGLAWTPGGTREAFHANAQALLRADTPAYCAASRMVAELGACREALTSAPVFRILDELGQDEPACGPIDAHILSNALNSRAVGAASPAHQDGGGKRLTVWIPLTPVSVRSHPLEVSPRSHLFGLLPLGATGAIEDLRIGEETFAPIPMQPGDVIVLSSLVVHRTGERGDGSVRVAVSSQFGEAAR
ncbi:MAG TPA: phytanoyl-CoA dioxygenase family protein [Caulobacteraceae bacterium]|nr:phytanoyl-CoA dioxygenase family protein [Caulobacteraceae bacterium]